MNSNITEIYNSIIELAWHFGNKEFNDKCCKDLSLVEFIVLKKITESENITIQDTANILSFTKSGASKIIDRLETKGYVTREISSIDGRVCCVNSTKKGVEVIEEIIEEYSIYLGKVLRGNDMKTIETIKSSLEIIASSVQKHETRKV